MHALVNLIERYQPGFAATVVPADEEEIDIIEAYAGPLPGAYRRFLQTMGGGMGAFQVDEATFKPMSIWNAYDQMKWLRRERFVLFAMDRGLAAWDYYLDRAAPYDKDDLMVVRMRLDPDFDPEQRMLVCSGLEEYLCYKAFAVVRLSVLPHLIHLRMREPPHARDQCTPEHVCALAEKLGFSRVSPARRCALYERGDAAILLYQDPVRPLFSFRVASDNEKEVRRLAERFQQDVGVVEQQ
jgi:hypothetical protein